MATRGPGKASSAKTEQISVQNSVDNCSPSLPSVQEVRSADSMSGAAVEIARRDSKSATLLVPRGRSFSVHRSTAHAFWLACGRRCMLLCFARRDGPLDRAIDQMTTIDRLQALPLPSVHEERRKWYGG